MSNLIAAAFDDEDEGKLRAALDAVNSSPNTE